MKKIYLFSGLLTAYFAYSALVYSTGTEIGFRPAAHLEESVRQGRLLYQKHNCTSCHQLFGLGGYLGPELTTSWSDPLRGPGFMKAFLQAGGPRMPNFHFTEGEVESLLQFLRYVDSTAITYKSPHKP